MKILHREKLANRTHIYLLGIKIASFPRKSKSLVPASLISCDIYNYQKLIENNTHFQHLVGVVISRAARIGKNCTIYQNVTIGSRDFATGDGKNQEMYPEIGDNVTIYAGAVIVGPVKVGDNAVIGANAVVISDVPANAVAVGVPARIIKHKK